MVGGWVGCTSSKALACCTKEFWWERTTWRWICSYVKHKYLYGQDLVKIVLFGSWGTTLRYSSSFLTSTLLFDTVESQQTSELAILDPIVSIIIILQVWSIKCVQPLHQETRNRKSRMVSNSTSTAATYSHVNHDGLKIEDVHSRSIDWIKWLIHSITRVCHCWIRMAFAFYDET